MQRHEGLGAVAVVENPALAAEDYNAVERAIEGEAGVDAVVVTVESVASLRRAYPNHFLDTTAFREAVEEVIEG